MSVAEIRPYQPGDTIKQIDRTSTAKKSELMTKITHQEEQLSILHCIPKVSCIPHDVLLETIASLSYAGLKYGDIVGAQIATDRFPPSRDKRQFTSRFEKLKTSTDAVSTLEKLLERNISKTLCILYLVDFPSDSQWRCIKRLAKKNTVIVMILVQQEVMSPKTGTHYAYAGYDLLTYQHDRYNEVLEEMIQTTRATMHEYGGKCILIQTGTDVYSQLAKQRTF